MTVLANIPANTTRANIVIDTKCTSAWKEGAPPKNERDDDAR